MPLVRVNGIIVNPMRCTERCPSIGAPREHHVRAIAAERADAGDHVNVVVSGAVGTVNGNEDLAGESARIDCTSETKAAAQVDCRDLVKRWRDGRVLRVARPNAPEAATGIPTADKKIPIASHVKRTPLRRVGNTNRSLPCRSGVGRATESSELAGGEFGPKLVLETVPHAGGSPVNGEPFLVAAVGASVG